jgi:hypothetical protein
VNSSDTTADIVMVFAKHLRDGVRRGRIKCTVRIWLTARVKPGGSYRMDEGRVVVDSIAQIGVANITDDLARESGFATAADLLQMARHGRGEKVFLIRFHYLPPGGWDLPRTAPSEPRTKAGNSASQRSQLLRRIRNSSPITRGKA